MTKKMQDYQNTLKHYKGSTLKYSNSIKSDLERITTNINNTETL